MTSSLPERYRRWFEYEKDSHARVLASLQSVPEPLRSDERLQKAVDLMAHLVAARWLWLHRFGAAGMGPSDLFPREVLLEDLPDRLSTMEFAWGKYLKRLDESELARVFEYQSLDGGRFRSSVEDVLTQLFGHSSYHRGQIAQLLRSLGVEPAVTDFIFWSREALVEAPVLL